MNSDKWIYEFPVTNYVNINSAIPQFGNEKFLYNIFAYEEHPRKTEEFQFSECPVYNIYKSMQQSNHIKKWKNAPEWDSM